MPLSRHRDSGATGSAQTGSHPGKHLAGPCASQVVRLLRPLWREPSSSSAVQNTGWIYFRVIPPGGRTPGVGEGTPEKTSVYRFGCSAVVFREKWTEQPVLVSYTSAAMGTSGITSGQRA